MNDYLAYIIIGTALIVAGCEIYNFVKMKEVYRLFNEVLDLYKEAGEKGQDE